MNAPRHEGRWTLAMGAVLLTMLAGCDRAPEQTITRHWCAFEGVEQGAFLRGEGYQVVRGLADEDDPDALLAEAAPEIDYVSSAFKELRFAADGTLQLTDPAGTTHESSYEFVDSHEVSYEDPLRGQVRAGVVANGNTLALIEQQADGGYRVQRFVRSTWLIGCT